MPLSSPALALDPLDRAAIYRAKTGQVDPLHAAVEAHAPLNAPPPAASPERVAEVV